MYTWTIGLKCIQNNKILNKTKINFKYNTLNKINTTNIFSRLHPFSPTHKEVFQKNQSCSCIIKRQIKQRITSFSTSSSHYIQTTDTDRHTVPEWRQLSSLLKRAAVSASYKCLCVFMCLCEWTVLC